MNGRAPLREGLWLAALLALLAAVGLARPLLPIDETRYAGVAWEMWARGDFLVPFRNGEAYHHKPPLLFWLIHAGWALFGVNEWWPRLISPLFAAGTLALTWQLGRRLWPQRPAVARMAPFVLLSSLLFGYFATALMFDVMLSFFVALGLLGIVRAWQDGGRGGGFAWLALGIGGALYAKGPVALLHLLPAALLAPWWMVEHRPPSWRRWYGGVGLAVLGGAALILAWAIPAAVAGGDEYRRAIFWGQTAGRMASSFAHRAPWWFYLAWLPVMLAPWLLWPRAWRGLHHGLWRESAFRLLALVVIVCAVAFTLISGKRWHYLLPEFAPFALLVARALCDSRELRWARPLLALGMVALGVAAAAGASRVAARLGAPDDAGALVVAGVLVIVIGIGLLAHRPREVEAEVRAIASAMVLCMVALLGAADLLLREPYDVARVGAQLGRYQREGRTVGFLGDYHGQWHLAGRLQQPLVEVRPVEAAAWLAAHPDARLVVVHKRGDELPAGARVELEQPRYRGSRLAIVAAP